jgi:NAD-dependent deacetylase
VRQRFQADQLPAAVELLRKWLADSQLVVAFTGAGISTESGIPDFRSPGGVWSKNRTVYFDEFLSSADARHEYWRQKSEAHRNFADAVPNVTHRRLAEWESAGLLRGVITQNIDGLHQDAGSQNVLELHGTARWIACLDCDWRDPADRLVAEFQQTQSVPTCPTCGGLLKHATVSFGQSLPGDKLRTAAQWATTCDLFLALGSSLVVEPAASLPRMARESGAQLVIVNRDQTPLDAIANLVINAPLGSVFEALSDS